MFNLDFEFFFCHPFISVSLDLVTAVMLLWRSHITLPFHICCLCVGIYAISLLVLFQVLSDQPSLESTNLVLLTEEKTNFWNSNTKLNQILNTVKTIKANEDSTVSTERKLPGLGDDVDGKVPHQHEDLSSFPRHPHKSQTQRCAPSCDGAGGLSNQSYPNNWAPGWRRDFVLKYKVGYDWGRHQPLAPTHVSNTHIIHTHAETGSII